MTHGLHEVAAVDDSPSITRDVSFGYVCGRCSRCCQHKHIQLDPYEIARLARARGESTTTFRASWTVDGRGTTLRQKPDGTCVFLGAEGCEVHPDRPLVCRLYPLGRHLRSDGHEYFSISGGHPQTAGKYTGTGTIADYLERQETRPFIEAGDAYFRWFQFAYARLAASDDVLISEAVAGADDQGILDMDAMIASHSAATGERAPQSLEARLQLHLSLLHQLVAGMEVDDAQET
jgi:uncharacterized protein